MGGGATHLRLTLVGYDQVGGVNVPLYRLESRFVGHDVENLPKYSEIARGNLFECAESLKNSQDLPLILTYLALGLVVRDRPVTYEPEPRLFVP